jgi:hypothetical protein
MLDVSIYLYKTKRHAEAGNKSGGSGFVISMPATQTADAIKNHKYAVTNKHLIEQGFTVLRVNTKDGRTDTIETEEKEWTTHREDDLAVYAFEPSDAYRINDIGYEVLLTQDMCKEREINIGSDVVTIGRFIEHDGKQQNLPVVRFGNIAMMPSEPIWNSDTNHMQESYLVEVHTVSGTSGSVVYATNKPFDADDKKGGVLGVAWGYLYRWEQVFYFEQHGQQTKQSPVYITDANGKHKLCFVRANTGMMAVVPAWKLKELLESEGLTMKRREKELRQIEDSIIPRSGASPAKARGELDDEDMPTSEEFHALLDKVIQPIDEDEES